MRVISYRDSCKENLIDCGEDVQKSDAVISHKESADVKQYTEDHEGYYLRQSIEEA